MATPARGAIARGGHYREISAEQVRHDRQQEGPPLSPPAVPAVSPDNDGKRGASVWPGMPGAALVFVFGPRVRVGPCGADFPWGSQARPGWRRGFLLSLQPSAGFCRAKAGDWLCPSVCLSTLYLRTAESG